HRGCRDNDTYFNSQMNADAGEYEEEMSCHRWGTDLHKWIQSISILICVICAYIKSSPKSAFMCVHLSLFELMVTFSASPCSSPDTPTAMKSLRALQAARSLLA